MWKSSEGYTPLWNKILSSDQDGAVCDGMCTYVLAAYLKNSVTRLVEPLRVMAWRVGACDVAMVVSAKQVERVLDARDITWRCPT